MSESVLIDEQGPVSWITLNRPEQLNTLVMPMVDRQQSLTALTADCAEAQRAFFGKRDPEYGDH